MAPPLFRAEITNVLHRFVQRGLIDRPDAADMIGLLLSFVAVKEPVGLYLRAFELADEFTLTAAYDSQYLALAEFEGCELWTADRRLVRSVGARFPLAHWLGEVE